MYGKGVPVTIEQLTKRANYWCQLLGVDDKWNIGIEIGHVGEMEGCRGMNIISPEYQACKIMIAPGEPEETLVHEILHIILDGHKADRDEYDPMHERAINKMASALVKLESNKKRGKTKHTGEVLQTERSKKQRASKARNSASACRAPKTI